MGQGAFSPFPFLFYTMRNYQIVYLSEYTVTLITEKFHLISLNNDSFSELKKRLEVEVKARLALVPGEITFSELVKAIIDQIQTETLSKVEFSIINNN